MLPILSLNRLASPLCCRDAWANVFFCFTTGKYCVHSFSFVNCLAFFPEKYSSYSITYLWILQSCQSLGLHFWFIPKSNISLNTCFAGNPTEFLSAECCLYTSACSRARARTHTLTLHKEKCIKIVALVGDWEQDDVYPNVSESLIRDWKHPFLCFKLFASLNCLQRFLCHNNSSLVRWQDNGKYKIQDYLEETRRPNVISHPRRDRFKV